MQQSLKLLPSKLISPTKQIILYLGLVGGVFFSDAITQFQISSDIDISTLFSVASFGRMTLCALVAIVIMPNVYEKLVASTGGSPFGNEGGPFFIQFCIFFQNGVFWSLILGAIGKTFSLKP